jgi:2-oxoglutarate dehydrogenase E2 component (dihydrolipoamide succinyltransferase)
MPSSFVILSTENSSLSVILVMPVELKVPEVGESITEVHISQWRKQVGQRVEKDENLVEIESDKATVDMPAPIAGTLTQIVKRAGDVARVGEVIGYMAAGSEAGTSAQAAAPQPTAAAAQPTTASVPVRAEPAAARVMPAAERLMAQQKISADAITTTGPGGRILKEDVQHAVEARAAQETAPVATATATAQSPQSPLLSPAAELQARGEIVPADLSRTVRSDSTATGYPREEELVVMSPIRRRIAERLVEAQHSAALLTTFNEVDMSAVIALRTRHREQYEKQYGVKLGFMSFFVKASVDALKHVPQLNAEVRDPHIVYHNYYDIGIAVGGGKGLVVPVLRNAEFMSFAEIEQKVADYGRRAKENKLKLEELQGGTFTISNGGVYGSMLSTPIVNPPQSGILGLHAIEDRPAVRDGQVVVRPMMYVALTYDHRIVDGREAVMFLKRIKETIEEPSRMLLEI